MEFGASVAKALLTGAKSTEVFSSLWDRIIVELEVNATLLVCENISIKMEIGRPLRVLQSKSIRMLAKVGQLILPLISLVGLPLLSKTGPCQDTSK